MRLDEIRDVEKRLAYVEELDFDNFIAEAYPNTPLRNICFQEYNALEFKRILNDSIKKLRALIRSDIKYMLPSTTADGYNISNTLIDIRTNIAAKNNDAAKIHLKRLWMYCTMYGSWKYSNAVNRGTKDIYKILSDVDIIKTKTEAEQKKVEDIIKEIGDAKESFDALIQDIKEQHKNISDMSGDMKAYVASADTNKSNIESIKQHISEYEKKISENIDEYNERFREIENANATSLKTLEEARVLNDEILSKRNEIENLIGAAADGSLGNQFRNRKIEIGEGVSAFILGVAIIVLFALAWTYYIFETFSIKPAESGLPVWAGLILNTIRISPMWWLLWWVVSRYNHERKLQEEYAFKAAVAMVMRQHSEMLSKTDNGNIEHRTSEQIMLMRTLNNLYENPYRDGKEKPNSINDNLSNILNAIKEMKK